jgi:REP-associated tyrosine transposase
VVNKINLLHKPLLRYQYFNDSIKNKKWHFFDFKITTCKTTRKRQKEGQFTTPVPVEPILLRTGATPLSTVMRRLMTGYAVTFNIRHRRSGHLFQNRYKSVVCEEENYLLELTRYIHLNPLRAGLVEDLNALDKYPWSGHSVLMGKLQNLLIPEMKEISQPERQGQPEKPSLTLAENTVDEVLRHFGSALNDARQHYRAFVEKGIKHGRRPELQGGGLVRSDSGDTSVLSPKDKENRELSDQRVLGSGGFACPVKCLCLSI